MHYYCPKCYLLLHESEVDVKSKSHIVALFVDEGGTERTIVHTGLTEEEY